MPQNWKTYKLSDFIEMNPKVHLKTGQEYSFVEMKDLDANNKYVLPSILKELKGGAKFQNGDTLFARITPCLENGKICQVKGLKNNLGFGSTEFLVFRGKEIVSDSDFVFYLSRTPEFRTFAEANMIGTSGRQRVAKEAFGNLEMKLPPLPEQTAIASILSALDDKIELNLQMNKTLEEMAMALYKHWFVDFGPFKDGKFVDSELGKIPEGWEVKKIKEFGDIICGKTPSKKDESNFSESGFPFIKIPDMHGKVFVSETTEKISDTGHKTQLNKLLPEGCINVSCIATVGLVSINAFPSHTNQQINSINPFRKSYTYFLYSTMIHLKDRFLNEASGGSATLNMNTSTFSNIIILAPEEIELITFDTVVTSLYEKIRGNLFENQTLILQRDSLLPKLISGEIRVKDVEKLIIESK